MIDFASMSLGDVVPLDVSPALASHNSMALLTADAVQGPKFDEGYSTFGIAGSDRKNLDVRQLCTNVVLSFEARQARARMKDILLVSEPFKIINAVVARVKVNMVDLLAIFWRSDKAACHHLVDKNADLCPVTAKLNPLMPIFPAVGSKYAAASDAQYIAKVGDTIKVFVARNWLPYFIHIKPLLVDSSVSVAWQLAQKPAFGSYPSQAGGF
jgi:hypothetical protein